MRNSKKRGNGQNWLEKAYSGLMRLMAQGEVR